MLQLYYSYTYTINTNDKYLFYKKINIIHNLKKYNYKLCLGTNLFISQLIMKIIILIKYLSESVKEQIMFEPMSFLLEPTT